MTSFETSRQLNEQHEKQLQDLSAQYETQIAGVCSENERLRLQIAEFEARLLASPPKRTKLYSSHDMFAKSSIQAAASAASVHSEIEAAFVRQQIDYHAKDVIIHNKEAPRVFTLQPTPSNVNAAAHGTVHRMPNGLTRSMEEEFKGSAFEKDYNYVVYGHACDTPGEIKLKTRQNYIRDEGHEGWTLQDFMTRPETMRIREAGLTMAEVAMLRIYPTAAWMLNSILRNEQGLDQWATSISILTSAIIKLSALSAKSPPHPIYRAIPNAVVDGGVADGPLSCGLVHFDDAFSSTTRNVETLLNYAGDPEAPALVFCIDPSWSCRAAALRELSPYRPHP
jgi:hypothetical protein